MIVVEHAERTSESPVRARHGGRRDIVPGARSRLRTRCERSGHRVPDVARTYADAEQLRAVFSEMFDDVADDEGMDGLVA